MPTPTWLAATSDTPAYAGQINQFLGAHASVPVYTGARQANQITAGSGAVNTNGLYLAQSFTTGSSQTTIGRIALFLAVTGTPTPITVSIQTDNSGAPSGTAVVTTLLPCDFLAGLPAAYFSIPLPVTGLSVSTRYWVVLSADGNASNYFSASKSNQTSGASTSTNGTSWTAQSYGFLYQVYDATTIMPLLHTWEDSGARWTLFAYAANGLLTTLGEFTQGQTAAGYMISARSFTYTNGLLTKIA